MFQKRTFLLNDINEDKYVWLCNNWAVHVWSNVVTDVFQIVRDISICITDVDRNLKYIISRKAVSTTFNGPFVHLMIKIYYCINKYKIINFEHVGDASP